MATNTSASNIMIAKESIVMIVCHVLEENNVLNPYDTLRDTGTGTGFFIDQHHILTNNHVVEDGDEIFIKAIGSQELIEVEILWIQPYLDMAILRQKKSTYTPKKFFPIGSAKSLRIGDPLEVIGYPLAGYYNNLKSQIGHLNGFEKNKIQHDCNVNPGTSGSPIIHNGMVVGLHKEGHTNLSGNIMFGATIDSLKLDRLLQLPQKGFVHIPHFPFDIQPIDSSHHQYLCWKYFLPGTFTGVIVCGGTEVFHPKDILTQIDEYRILCNGEMDFHNNKENFFHLNHYASYLLSKDTVKLQILRLKKEVYEEITLQVKMLGPTVGSRVKVKPNALILRDLIIQDLNEDLAMKINHYGTLHIPIITHIFDNSISTDLEIIEPGTVIAKVDDHTVKSVKDIEKVLLSSQKKNKFVVLSTMDNYTVVMRKTDILHSITNRFSQWKITPKPFYEKIKKLW